MADAISWVSSNWLLIGGTASAVVAGASAIMMALAPLTKTDKDDKVARWLGKVLLFINKLALNPPLK